MAILKIKKLIEDLELNTTLVLSSMTKLASTATVAGSAAYSGTGYLATSANYAGSSRVAHFASSGTANIAGTSAVWSTGGL